MASTTSQYNQFTAVVQVFIEWLRALVLALVPVFEQAMRGFERLDEESRLSAYCIR